MRWDVVDAPPAKTVLAQTLVEVTAKQGWGQRSLEEAARATLGDRGAWSRFLPEGSRDAIWFISEVSDASMRATFATAPAIDMSAVIAERFAQNSDLKPFVRRVMLFDLAHPLQALARMQRTARVMVECLAPPRRRIGGARLSALNVAYTLTVFIWLFDREQSQSLTRGAATTLMRLLCL